MTDKKTAKNLSAKPVIYVHAKDHERTSERQFKALLELGLPLCSRLAAEGITQTENGYDQPGLLLAEITRLFPGRPVMFLRAGIQPSKYLIAELSRILEWADQPMALTVLSNAEATVNPYAGLLTAAQNTDYDLAGLVALLAPGQLHTLAAWTDHLVILSVKLAAGLLDKTSDATAWQQLLAEGGTLKVPDHLFLHDPDSRVFDPMKLQAHETAFPPPFSELSARLQDWFNTGITNLPIDPFDDSSATLHITHSWGGGVAQWLHSLIKTDRKHTHFQLRSEDPQSGRGFGQKLSLYAGNELRCPIASWWLQPAIKSIVDNNAQYREILSEVCNRYAVGRVFVSSLVGHSLDALGSGVPTLQILHDHFPLWPLLSVNPQPYLQADAAPNLELALHDHRKNREFPDKDASAWLSIRHAYLQAINDFNIRIAAPGQSVLDLQNQLEPSFKTLTSAIIPQG